jgi:subtilisin family serine protease
MTIPSGPISVEALRPRTGRGIRIGVVDSGVHPLHPHVGGVEDGVSVDAEGTLSDDFIDRLGHGTAVTAAIREKAPEAEILVAKVFDRRLETTAAALVAAIRWAVGSKAHLINLSLGTRTAAHAEALRQAVREARAAGVRIVAAGEHDGVRWLPGTLPGVVSVGLDWSLPREQCLVHIDVNGEVRVAASGFPRPIPGVPPERNMKGLSFAVANATGLLALALQGDFELGAGSQR